MPKCAIPYYTKNFPGIKEDVPPPDAPKGYHYMTYFWCPIPGPQPQDPNKVKYWPHYILKPNHPRDPRHKVTILKKKFTKFLTFLG